MQVTLTHDEAAHAADLVDALLGQPPALSDSAWSVIEGCPLDLDVIAAVLVRNALLVALETRDMGAARDFLEHMCENFRTCVDDDVAERFDEYLVQQMELLTIPDSL